MVAQSSEVNNALVLLAAVGALSLFGSYTFSTMIREMTLRLGHLSAPPLTVEGSINLFHETTWAVARAVVPLLVCVGVMGLACSVGQVGFVFSSRALSLDLNRLNPVNGLKNLFSFSSLVRLLVAVAKLTVISLIIFFLLRDRMAWITSLVGQSTWGILDVARRLCLSMMLRVAVAMLVVAVLDYGYQRWRYERQLMMTKTEWREEMKKDEGSPEVRARQAQVRRDLARLRMMQAVPRADVVVTNPTHMAVALRWDEATMSAPRVVAKGKNYVAERIKEIARAHGVPILERKTLAQALYEVVEIGMEIPPKLYYAVAEVLAFVMRGKAA